MFRSVKSAVIIIMILILTACVPKHRSDIYKEKIQEPSIRLGITVKAVLAGKCCFDNKKEIKKLLEVTHVKQHSFAEQIGILNGDLLYTISGKHVTGIHDSYAVLAEYEQGEIITLGVFRKNKLLILRGQYN
jgi:S1-C subfamily serine protease